MTLIQRKPESWRGRVGVLTTAAGGVAAQGGHRCPDQLIPAGQDCADRHGAGPDRYHGDSLSKGGQHRCLISN
jgi:hypothetical protein